ncbi:diacylglycerol kinase family protein [soil metagenome]
MRLLLVVNSSASSVTPQGTVAVQQALSAGHDVTIVQTDSRGHATRLAQTGATEGYEVVAVFGGDGTLNEAANGLVGTDTALAPLPGGSTNVFARTLGISLDPVEAANELVEALARGNVRSVGLGSVNGRYFLFHLGMGFDAAVVSRVERLAGLKRYLGHPLFVWCAFDTGFRHYDTTKPRFSVHYPDGTVIDDGYFTICLNTNPYTFLGSRPLDLAPEATLDRELVVLTLRSLAFCRTLVAAGAALIGGGRLQALDHVHQQIDVGKVTVRGDVPFPYQVDGDYLGETELLEVRHEPDVLRLVMPRFEPTVPEHRS